MVNTLHDFDCVTHINRNRCQKTYQSREFIQDLMHGYIHN